MAWRRLAYLNAAERLGDLAVPPGNQLEKLKGERSGQYSIRVNDQYRLCFRWRATGPEDVELVDDH
jgi:proteic killer suppression protein